MGFQSDAMLGMEAAARARFSRLSSPRRAADTDSTGAGAPSDRPRSSYPHLIGDRALIRTAVPLAPVREGRNSLGRAAAGLQRRVWGRRVRSWHHHGVVVVQPVVDEVLRLTPAGPGLDVVDIGCGTGSLALPLARVGASVVAVDVSPPMIEMLQVQARAEGLRIEGLAHPAEQLAFPEASLDAVVSNYALHHLRDQDKARLVNAAARWLRPGGHLVIGDMMFGRGATADDRRIIAAKVAGLVRKGPGGLWRVAKNTVRFLLRVQERPLRAERWAQLLADAGLADIQVVPVMAEATVVRGTRPAAAGASMGV